jgi:methionyl aminopeptidase
MTNAPLQPGDLISIDVGVRHRGFVGDAAWTFAIESVSEEAARLMEAGRESLRRGLEAMRAGRPLVDWARAVQQCAEQEFGFHLVRGLGGHGYGHKLHGPPFVSNVLPRHQAEWPDAFTLFEPGMLLAVEPMIAIGTSEVRSEPRAWPIFTADGSLSVHYEADVLITEDGPRDLTEGMDQLPDLVG